MNLTTVRTHQYAVWITVGFFEVTRQGDPGMLGQAPQPAYDILGPGDRDAERQRTSAIAASSSWIGPADRVQPGDVGATSTT